MGSIQLLLSCPGRLLRISKSVKITAQVQGDNPDPLNYTFHWSVSAGEIKQLTPTNTANYTASNRPGTVEIKVEARDKNNQVFSQTLSIIVYKQIGFIKADDLERTDENTIPPNWQTFVNYITQKRVNACIGIKCDSLESDEGIYIGEVKKIVRNEYFELFNHGYDHFLSKTVSEFYNTPLEYQKEHLVKAQNVAKQKLNLTLRTFGAPGNNIDNNTTIAMESVPDLKVWFFGNPCSKLLLNSDGDVETATGEPNYENFVKNYNPLVDSYVLQIHPNQYTPEKLNTFNRIVDFLIQKEMTFMQPYEYYRLTLPYTTTSPVSLSRTTFNTGADTNGHSTPPQFLHIEDPLGESMTWFAYYDSPWIIMEPSSGNRSESVSISVNPTGLLPGTYNGSIKIKDDITVNIPQIVNISLTVYNAGTTVVPFGDYATPADGITVSGSIAVTGWVLDDIGTKRITIYSDKTYIGEGVFVEGARPDVEAAYPGYPLNYCAGWGYMLLTNSLPGGGNGVYTLNVFAVDVEGNEVKLGSKTITVDNKNAVKPFGAIDTPMQGGIVAGKEYVNFGWVLTPMPNTIPIDGSTIHVYIDGVEVGRPVYNLYRSDIATLFPGYANSNGAAGYFILNTTAFKNGLHTIAWNVTDNAGNTDGVGSRYFIINN